MTTRKSLIIMGFMALLPACDTAAIQNPPESPAPAAVGTLHLGDGTPAGEVAVTVGPHGLLVRVEAENLPPGWHGTHLHAAGHCEGPGFESAGGHLNAPDPRRPHGLLNPDGPDLGDLQNLWVHADGVGRAELYLAGTEGVDLDAPSGLALVIHANPDDHLSQPIGGAGARIACGVLRPSRD